MHLELGGKSANIILPDADFERAVVDGIQDAFRNTGQVCGGLTRMLVPQNRLQEAEALAKRTAESYVLGDPWDPKTTLGPVSTSAARDRVRGYIRSALDEGVRMLTGGAEAPEGLSRGWFVRPTVFSGDNNSRIAREEIFGPVVVIIPFEDEADAIAHRQRLGVRPRGWRLVPRCRARACGRRQAAHRPRSHQRRAAGQARHAWRIQALGRRPRMGPLRHRGIPRIQIDHGLTTRTAKRDHHEPTYLPSIARPRARIARRRRIRAGRGPSHQGRGSAAGRQLERLTWRALSRRTSGPASARPSSSTTRPAATASSAPWTSSRSAPDGNTLLLGSLSPLATNVALVKNLPYDPRRDLTPIAGVSVTNWVLMVKASSPVRTLAEFVAHAKQKPGSVSIGYSTTTVQVQIATLNKMAGIELLAVPYKGTPATITDVLGGSLDATLADPGQALAQVKGGRLRALAVSSLKRNPGHAGLAGDLRDVPRIRLLGLERADGSSRHVARAREQDQRGDERGAQAEGGRRQVRRGGNDAAHHDAGRDQGLHRGRDREVDQGSRERPTSSPRRI